jgi:large subunit ribosomal protein L5
VSQVAARLKEKYLNEVAPALREKYGYRSVMEIPKIDKVVINMGVGEAVGDPKSLDAAVSDLTAITGQKPIITRAKKSIASFKLRARMPIGCKVTLRGERMYHFLDKLFNVALPRIRDFRGVSADGFDGRGNYNLGLKEQLVFPEIVYDKIDKLRGMDISIVTTARTDEEGYDLLKAMGMPFSS